MAFTTPITELIERNSNGLLGKHPDWQRVRLGDVATIQNGAAFKSEYFNTEGQGMPLLRIRDVLPGATETWYDGPYDAEYVVSPGDLVVGMDGDFNHALWKGPEALLNQRVCRLIFKSDALRQQWVLHVLGGYLQAVNEATPSITVKHLSSRTIAALLLPAPGVDEQDEIIGRMNGLLETIAQGEQRFRQAQHEARNYRRAVIRDVLDGDWPYVALKDVLVSLRNGIFVSRPEPQPPGIPIFRISAVRPMTLNVADFRYAPLDLARKEQYLVGPGDLLFTRYSGNPELVGACALVPENTQPTLHPDKLIRGVVDRSLAEPSFLELACSGGRTWQEIRASRKTTAGQVGIAGNQLASVKVPLPPLGLQRDLAEVCRRQLDAVERFLVETQAVCQAAQSLNTALCRAAVTGELSQAQSARDGSNGWERNQSRAVLVGE